MRRQTECKNQGRWMDDYKENIIFWAWQGSHTHELTAFVMACTKLVQAPKRPNYSMVGRDLQSYP